MEWLVLVSQDVAEVAGVTSAPQIVVYKQGRPAGQPLLSQHPPTMDQAEAVLLRHILKSQPA